MVHEADKVGVFWLRGVPDIDPATAQTAERHATTRAGQICFREGFCRLRAIACRPKIRDELRRHGHQLEKRHSEFRAHRCGAAVYGHWVWVREFRERIALASADWHCTRLSGNRLPDLRGNFILA